jgi:DNA-binding MarR family transcriptional regulator
MAEAFDIREFTDCSCLRLRRAARDVTRLYDRHLEPTGLGANQLTMLTTLYGIDRFAGGPVTMRVLADHAGLDQTTLSRNLKPLVRQGLVSARPGPADRRARILAVTAKGRAKLNEAWPLWRRAQAEMKKALGADALGKLHRLLDRSADRLRA